MPFAHGNPFLFIWPGSYTTRSVKAGMVFRPETVGTRIMIDIMHPIPVHVHNRCIIFEVVTMPPTAVEARTKVAIAIVYTAVITYAPTPISPMKYIKSIIVTPITRSPEISVPGWFYPFARYPVIFIPIPCPVTGHPKVTIPRT